MIGIMMRTLFISIFLMVSHANAEQREGYVYFAKLLETANGQLELLDEGFVPGNAESSQLSETRYPEQIIEHAPIDSNTIVEIKSSDSDVVKAFLSGRHIQNGIVPDEGRDEVIPIYENGPPANRIDLVIMGDGYTQAERQKFVDDAKRLASDMFKGETFSSYLPVFNVYAVFRASNVSGIGKNSQYKDTAYRLYREGNTLRAIFMGNKSAARSSCKKAPGCDYPIVMGNDPFYGGLGGEFAITTSSPTSGTVVLRHELGHNFGRVGEEYDGGGYFGANYSYSSNVSWQHWAKGKIKAQPATAHFLDWPWHNLSDGPYEINFTSHGKYKAHHIRFSASGIETSDTLELTHNGKALPFVAPLSKDRHFHDLDGPGFDAGDHTIRFKELVSDGDNWVSSAIVQEFEPGFNFEKGYVSAYPNFLKNGSVAGYRATNESCLMRNMLSTQFCSICQENNWMHFFQKIDVLDEVKVAEEKNIVNVAAIVPPLGQFRVGKSIPGEKIEIRWYQDGAEILKLKDQAGFRMNKDDAAGSWELKVKFITPEVRKDSGNLLSDSKKFTI